MLENMVARRVSKGYNEGESRAFLADLMEMHTKAALAESLVYFQFATAKQAQEFIDGLAEGETYAESFRKLKEAREQGVTHVTIEIDEGRVTLSLEDAEEAFNELAPGEGFQVIDAGWSVPLGWSKPKEVSE